MPVSREGLVRETSFDSLRVCIYQSRDGMAKAAASYFASLVRELLKQHPMPAVMFATGMSQMEFLRYLTADKTLEWSRIRALHMDEYAGLPATHPASFRKYLQDNLVNRAPGIEFCGIEGDAADTKVEIRRYSELFESRKPELCAMGIGENGHIAFNDPPADFNDPKLFKIVSLDSKCRAQQVHEGWFPNNAAVPRSAITATVTALMSIPRLVVTVPGERKTEAVARTLLGKIEESCPASILRRHSNAHLFLDSDSAAGLE
ncbi:MAG TPA: 6-phosphogluconolactonase [Acidobacteriota bacterium]|jgi:glucosamine-6-phosphate deaminase